MTDTTNDPNAGGAKPLDRPEAHEVDQEPLGERPADAPNPGVTPQPGETASFAPGVPAEGAPLRIDAPLDEPVITEPWDGEPLTEAPLPEGSTATPAPASGDYPA